MRTSSQVIVDVVNCENVEIQSKYSDNDKYKNVQLVSDDLRSEKLIFDEYNDYIFR